MGTLLAYLAICLMCSNHQTSDLFISDNTNTGDIVVHVDKVTINRGTLYVGLFDSRKTFRKISKVYKFEQAPTSTETTTVILRDVPFNEYALVVFQDYNENQKFDENFFGYPVEPFGFSTNFKVKSRAPRYEDVVFKHAEFCTELKVDLQSL